ncbi:MAG: SIS domain-containing protein [Ruminiclostridium sp.]|nr:SIS domain-containing protein [Ruminiclostridium sp.]
MTLMWKEILEQPEALERCHVKNAPVIKEIVRAVKSKNVKQVVLAARGTSDHAAGYGKFVIELLLGIPVSLAASSIFTVYQGNMNFENCLVIGVSQSGRAADELEVMRSAKKNGAVTVGITNNAESEIAHESEYFLNCEAGLEKSVAATKTFGAQIFLLAALAAEWAENKNIQREIYRLPERISQVYDVSEAIGSKVERYRFMNECFVLARGINYAISLEAALKIQETTYVRAKAFATSDFQHGPIAMIDRDIPVFIFAPDGPSLKDVTGMIEKMRNEQIETIVISNRTDILDLGTTAFRIPDTSNDIISPFFNVIVAQMFACKLALAKGLNPDCPRGLNKVTVTK